MRKVFVALEDECTFKVQNHGPGGSSHAANILSTREGGQTSRTILYGCMLVTLHFLGCHSVSCKQIKLVAS